MPTCLDCDGIGFLKGKGKPDEDCSECRGQGLVSVEQQVQQQQKHKDKFLLTQEEVDKLPGGVLVEVLWSGGNGPHLYITRRLDGMERMYAYAASTRPGIPPIHHELYQCGKRPLTEVRKVMYWK